VILHLKGVLEAVAELERSALDALDFVARAVALRYGHLPSIGILDLAVLVIDDPGFCFVLVLGMPDHLLTHLLLAIYE